MLLLAARYNVRSRRRPYRWGSFEVAGDAPGVARDGCRAGDAGQPVGAAEVGQVAVGGGEQFGCQQMSEAGHAGDDGGEPVLVKRLFNPAVNLGELVVEVKDVVSQARDHTGCAVPRPFSADNDHDVK